MLSDLVNTFLIDQSYGFSRFNMHYRNDSTSLKVGIQI